MNKCKYLIVIFSLNFALIEISFSQSQTMQKDGSNFQKPLVYYKPKGVRLPLLPPYPAEIAARWSSADKEFLAEIEKMDKTIISSINSMYDYEDKELVESTENNLKRDHLFSGAYDPNISSYRGLSIDNLYEKCSALLVKLIQQLKDVENENNTHVKNLPKNNQIKAQALMAGDPKEYNDQLGEISSRTEKVFQKMLEIEKTLRAKK